MHVGKHVGMNIFYTFTSGAREARWNPRSALCALANSGLEDSAFLALALGISPEPPTCKHTLTKLQDALAGFALALASR